MISYFQSPVYEGYRFYICLHDDMVCFVGFYSDKHKTLPQVEPVLCDETVEQKSSIAVCLFLLNIQLNVNFYLFEILNRQNSGRVSLHSIHTSPEKDEVKILD